MDSDFYEKENDKIVDLMIEHKAPEEKFKAPDCVCQTIIKRMEQLNDEISDCKELLYKLEAEYTAHASFIMNGPFEYRNLSQSSENMIKALSLRAEAKGGTDGGESFQD